jgi:hypothetical protein
MAIPDTDHRSSQRRARDEQIAGVPEHSRVIIIAAEAS